MSDQTAFYKLIGHGRVICEKCNKVITSCRCFDCDKNIQYDICDDCEAKEKEIKNET